MSRAGAGESGHAQAVTAGEAGPKRPGGGLGQARGVLNAWLGNYVREHP